MLRRCNHASRITHHASRFTLIHLPVNGGDLLHPAPPVGVFQLHDLPLRPVEVVRDERYLPQELIEGVANDPPSASGSGANWWRHSGQTIVVPSLGGPLSWL